MTSRKFNAASKKSGPDARMIEDYIRAVRKNDCASIKKFVKKHGVYYINAHPRGVLGPLPHAILSGKTKAALLLVELGASFHRRIGKNRDLFAEAKKGGSTAQYALEKVQKRYAELQEQALVGFHEGTKRSIPSAKRIVFKKKK